MTMLKILCKLVSKQQSNSMLKKVKSMMRNASSYPLSNLWFHKDTHLHVFHNVSYQGVVLKWPDFTRYFAHDVT